MKLLKKLNGSLTPALKNISIMVGLVTVFIFVVLSYDSKVETSDLNCVEVKVDSLGTRVTEIEIRNEYRDKAIEEVNNELKDIGRKIDKLLRYSPQELVKQEREKR